MRLSSTPLVINITKEHDLTFTLRVNFKKLSILVCLLLPFSLFSQRIELHFSEEAEQIMGKRTLHVRFTDSTSAMRYLTNQLAELINKGYYTASIDTLRIDQQDWFPKIYIGPRFEGIYVKNEDNKKDKIHRYSSNEFFELQTDMLKTYVNAGYPFARVLLSSIEIDSSQLVASIQVEPGKLYPLKYIYVQGDSSLSPNLISNLLDIRVGEYFNADKLESIPKRLKQFNFITQIKSPELVFSENGFDLYLYLSSNPISSVNGLVGIQQNPVSLKTVFTGDIQLRLQNDLHVGETILFNWKSRANQDQTLFGTMTFPFLLKTSFGTSATFRIDRRDTSTLNTRSNIGLTFSMPNRALVKFYIENNQTNQLSQYTKLTLPEIQSFRYGISYFTQALDYIPSPTEGHVIQTTIACGNRTSTLQAEQQKNTLYTGDFSWSTYHRIFRSKHILKGKLTYSGLFANNLFSNELVSFGGFGSLRGFDEDALHATSYCIGSIEYRFLLDKNSFLTAFYDQGYYENYVDGYQKDAPYGLGAGITLGTKAGMFSMLYAVGKQHNTSFQINAGKIHFGYVNFF